MAEMSNGHDYSRCWYSSDKFSGAKSNRRITKSTSLDPTEQINQRRFFLPSRFTDLSHESTNVTEIGILIDTLMNIQQAARYKSLKNPSQHTARFACAEYDISVIAAMSEKSINSATLCHLKGEGGSPKRRRDVHPFGTNVITHRWRDSSDDEASDDNH